MTQNSVIVRCFLEKFTTSHVKRNKEKSKTGHTTKLKVMNKNDSKIIAGMIVKSYQDHFFDSQGWRYSF